METLIIKNEIEKIISSFTIEDYLCDTNGGFLTTDINGFLKPLQENVKLIVEENLPRIVRDNQIEVNEIDKSDWFKKTRNVKRFDRNCADYFDLRNQASDLYMSFDFISLKVKKEVIDEDGDVIDLYEEDSGEIYNVYFQYTDIKNIAKKFHEFFKDELLMIPKYWKEIISKFIDSDIEKIGELKFDYGKYSEFSFKNMEFNNQESASIIAIKKALKTSNFFKNKNSILLDLRNGLSCKIEFKKKGRVLTKYSIGNNKVISSEIESFYDENGRRSIGKLNRFYFFLLEDYIIKIEFVKTGILR